MNKDLKMILSRISILFERKPRTRYWVQIVNDKYDHSYNWFFNSQRLGERLKSIPIQKLDNYELKDLEELVHKFHNINGLTIQYVGFTGLKWPQSKRMIQWKKDELE